VGGIVKYLDVTFSDGQVWRVPLEVIAKHAAEYFRNDAPEGVDPQSIYDSEYEGLMNGRSTKIIVWWARQYMDWSLMESGGAYLLHSPDPLDLDGEFATSKMEVNTT